MFFGWRMPKYYPLEQPLTFKISYSDLIALTWKNGALTADFVIPGESVKALRVYFHKTEIIRILDEFVLSTEEGDRNAGLVAEHFAYSVEDAPFWKSQSETFRLVFSKVRHYCFITGNGCLDVISDVEPSMSVVTRSRKIQTDDKPA